MYFLIFLQYLVAKKIVYMFNAENQEIDQWIISQSGPYFSLCNGKRLFGGAGIFYANSYIMRNFELPPHYRVYIDIEFYIIDGWNNDLIRIYLEDQIEFQQQYTLGSGSSICGQPLNDKIIQISIDSYHTHNLALFEVYTGNAGSLTYECWGISQLIVSVEPCPAGCVYCESRSLSCKQWSLQYQDNRPHTSSYQNFPLYLVLLCGCSYSIQIPQVHQIMIRFGSCVLAGSTLMVDILVNGVFKDRVSFQNLYHFYALSQAAIKFNYHFKTQVSIQLVISNSYPQLWRQYFQIFVQQSYQEQNLFIPGCLHIIQDICWWECEIGWLFDEQFMTCLPEKQQETKEIKRIIQNNLEHFAFYICLEGYIYDEILMQCIPYCGDKYIAGNEECDDGNIEPYDGCYNCKFQCEINCLKCLFGLCYQCYQGYQLNSDQNCETNCGDGQIIPYYEQCDDMNTKKGDGCNECELECIINRCIRCNSVICFECDTGTRLEQNLCIPICGDNIIIPEYEDCDDGNDEQYDGCYNCSYQCFDCENCVQGACFDQVVESICGDEIIEELEECDDGNNIQYDGCYQCSYSCPLYCKQCNSGICLKCQENFILEKNSCQSYNICGDGIKGQDEKCDDGNNQANDGCYQCQIELDWICNDINPSECVFYKSPFFIVKYLNSTFQQQNVHLTFSQEVQLLHESTNVIQGQIQNLAETNYEIVVQSLIDLTNTLAHSEFMIKITYKQLITQKQILQIDLDKQIVNENQINLQSYTKQLYLPIPDYLNPNQKAASQQISNVNKKIIYCLAGVSLISLISGETSIMQEILNSIQQLSLLRFINVEFPQNVDIFFLFSDMITITPFLNFINFDQYKFALFQQGLPTIGKFEYYNQEADLITNLVCQFAQLIGYLLLFYLFKILQRIVLKKLLMAKYIYCMSYLSRSFPSNFTFQFFKLLTYKIVNLIKLQMPKFHELLLLNSWDLLFKVLLYMRFMQLNEMQDYFKLLISLLISCAYFTLILKLKKQIFEIFSLVRQMIFLFLLVFIQSNQVLQNVSILLVNSTYCILIIIFSKYQKKELNYIQLIIESTVVLFTFSSFSYFDDINFIDVEWKIFIGFAQIGIISLGLCIQLCGQIIMKVKQMRNKVKLFGRMKRLRLNQRKALSNLFI